MSNLRFKLDEDNVKTELKAKLCVSEDGNLELLLNNYYVLRIDSTNGKLYLIPDLNNLSGLNKSGLSFDDKGNLETVLYST